MKHPKIILHPNTYPINTEKVTYTEFKYHKKMYKDCYEYIHWWQNTEGKWRCFKIYLEKGNQLYREYIDYLQNGNDETGWHSKFVEF